MGRGEEEGGFSCASLQVRFVMPNLLGDLHPYFLLALSHRISPLQVHHVPRRIPIGIFFHLPPVCGIYVGQTDRGCRAVQKSGRN